ncbi:MAG TPA: LPS assembly protein LptD [Phycisphaerales bacterium]|nr:LPS assembly protein LptD [Phycisphaerales bacterium]
MVATFLPSSRRRHAARCVLLRTIAMVLSTMAALAFVPGVRAQPERPRILGDRLSGFVLPIEPLTGDIEISGLRAAAWEVDDTRRLFIQGDVVIVVAGQRFHSREATVWLNRIPSEGGLINQFAMYFDDLTDPLRPAGAGVAGRNLLATGSARGEVKLNVALLRQERPVMRDFLRRAETRLAAHLESLLTDEQRLRNRPLVHVPPQPDTFVPIPGGTVESIPAPPREPVFAPVPVDGHPWLGPPGGEIHFAAAEVQIVSGEEENVITLLGPLVIEQIAPGERFSRMTLSAQRGVIFTDPMPLEEMLGNQLEASAVRGIYLEGNVIIRAGGSAGAPGAAADEYTVRAPQVYYDFRTDQALLLDAVLRTYSRQQQMPVYARAQEMRQIAEDQWTTQRVTVSTSEFHQPHLAVGARRVAVRQSPAEDGGTETYVDARDVTLRANNVPVFYMPRFAGTIGDTALRSIQIGARDTDGLRVFTTWNLATLLGVEAPDGVDMALRLDGFTKRGGGAGLLFRYDAGAIGEVDLYGMYDTGEDRTSTGRRVTPDEDWRGVALWSHHQRLHPDWTLQAQTSYISDETFITTWREDDYRMRREYETSVYLKGQRDHTAITLLAKHELNDFISNEYLLASRQYQVDKMPELTYRRYGDTFGAFTYSTESRVGRMRMVFEENTPRRLGVRPQAFGIGLNDPIDQMLLAGGLREFYVGRADTRHELAMPFNVGIFRVVPFVVGRVTAYSKDFKHYSSDADDMRFHAAGGVNVSTQFQRVDNSVNSRVFDLHRMRHIIEPRLMMWYGYSDVTRYALPAYDFAVEEFGDGAAAQIAVRNTWQTQRGGPGQWRSVDVLTVDTGLVIVGDGATRRHPVPQFIEYRPEYSQFGDHFFATAMWLPSDSLSVGGQIIYDMDASDIARGSIGFGIEHSPALTTYVEYRYLKAVNLQLLDASWIYRISPKYRLILTPQWDFVEGSLRAFNVNVTRSFPDFDLILRMGYDRVRDETTFSATIGLVRF